MSFKVENIGLSFKCIHIIDLVILILIAIDKVDHIVPSSRTKKLFYRAVQLYSMWDYLSLPVQKQELFLVSAPSQTGTELLSIVMGDADPEMWTTVKVSILIGRDSFTLVRKSFFFLSKFTCSALPLTL